MNRVSDALAYSHHDIAHAVGEWSEMVDGGYIADLTAAQIAVLKDELLPTGRGASWSHAVSAQGRPAPGRQPPMPLDRRLTSSSHEGRAG